MKSVFPVEVVLNVAPAVLCALGMPSHGSTHGVGTAYVIACRRIKGQGEIIK